MTAAPDLHAQKVAGARRIIAMGKCFGSSVVLRWAPTTAAAWQKANISGYEVYRFEVDSSHRGDPLTHQVQLTTTPLLPFTLDRWRQQFQPQDTAAAIAVELLYGKKFQTSMRQNGRLNWGDANTEQADMENRLGMALFNADLHPDIAGGMGWRWEDKTVEQGKLYYYLVISRATNGQPADTSSALVSTRQAYKIPVMLPILCIPWDRTVTLYWNKAATIHVFGCYWIERSDDNGATFHRLNGTPYVDANKGKQSSEWYRYTDSVPKNSRMYVYRVKGVTAFGEISEPSPPLKAAGIDKTSPGSPVAVKAENIRGSQVRISWKKSVREKDLAGYLIGRGNSANGPFFPLDTVLVPPTALAYTDKNAVTWDKNFYIVAAIDTAGNAARSLPAYATIIDSIAPAAPVGLAGSIDTAGVVRLHWRWNKEMDLQGYNVYASNDPGKAFYILNKKYVTDTSYTDTITIKTLTRRIYYRLCAIDKSGNPSKYSNILALTKPDIVAPVPPVIVRYTAGDSSVYLQWAVSSSDDVAWQAIWRREKGQVQWVRLDSLGAKANSYTDRRVVRLGEYDYCLSAIDSSGLSSERSFPLHARIYDNGKRAGIDTLGVSLTEKRSFRLVWRYSLADRQHIRFLLYRNYNSRGLEMYKNIDGGVTEFTDLLLPGEGEYQYALKVITDDGGSSSLVSSKIIKLDKK